MARVLIATVLALLAAGQAAAGISAETLGIVVNARDPLSVAIGAAYARARRVPAANVVRVDFDPVAASVSREAFEAAFMEVTARLPPSVQALALTWTKPYRVECMSISSAFAFGFDPHACASDCSPTRFNRYFDSDSEAPYTELGIRPTMAIAARSAVDARRLIARGVASDGTRPEGTVYLVRGGDPARSVRDRSYAVTRAALRGVLDTHVTDLAAIGQHGEIFALLVGASRVEGLEALEFAPGAIADHLTSYGGDLGAHGQMSSIEWLRAGATGSYGTVVEPCAFPHKFPSPTVLLRRYAAGETLIAAYWKSVAMPGQGLFVGEPLARPFATGGLHVAGD